MQELKAKKHKPTMIYFITFALTIPQLQYQTARQVGKLSVAGVTRLTSSSFASHPQDGEELFFSEHASHILSSCSLNAE